MQWSKLRIQFEAFFADSIKGRVRLHSTRYRGMHDQDGRDWITVDGEELVNIPHWYRWVVDARYNPRAPSELTPYTALCLNGGLGRAMFSYRSLSIDEILRCDNILIRALGMLDRRVGKRRLRTMEVENDHPLVRLFFHLRCEAEGITAPGSNEVKDEVDLRHLPGKRSHPNKEERQRAVAKLQEAKKTRKPRALLGKMERGELSLESLDTAVAQEIQDGLQRSPNREALLSILRWIETKTKLLKSAHHVRGVIELSRNAVEWLRPLEQWIVKSHNPDRQFSTLARHLWAFYPVPLFMDKAWLQGTPLQQQWFRHLGAGKNIRDAEQLPILLTKRMAHFFLEAPDHYSIEAALRWGQVFALGGDSRLADALRETRLVGEFRDDEFWLSVIRFFIRNPMLDTAHIPPLVDYIWNQRYEPRVVFVERGVAREVGPEQPNFSMRGRAVSSLLRAMEQWHRRLGREIPGGELEWCRSSYNDFEFIEGDEHARNMQVWRIRQLLSSRELIVEGQRMRHCVASYAQSCHRGKCSIWSMELETEEGIEPCLTLEVNHGSREICQARGKCNRVSTAQEKDIIRRWASREKLKVASYI
jgi:hypothetical protein